MNIPTIDVLRGTNKKFIPEFKKELIDEELKIVRISNEFGCIDIMEEARYSPATNSVANFQVDKKYQSLGIGTELLKEALRIYDDLGAQISSIASIKTFLKNGFDFNGNQPNTSQDFLRYDFNVFQKSPYLLNNKNNGIYKIHLENFNNKFEQAINRFNENGGSVFLRFDKRIEPKVENKTRNRFKM
jgi:GNAT superfamily N-acetyltransferase